MSKGDQCAATLLIALQGEWRRDRGHTVDSTVRVFVTENEVSRPAIRRLSTDRLWQAGNRKWQEQHKYCHFSRLSHVFYKVRPSFRRIVSRLHKLSTSCYAEKRWHIPSADVNCSMYSPRLLRGGSYFPEKIYGGGRRAAKLTRPPPSYSGHASSPRSA